MKTHDSKHFETQSNAKTHFEFFASSGDSSMFSELNFTLATSVDVASRAALIKAEMLAAFIGAPWDPKNVTLKMK